MRPISISIHNKEHKIRIQETSKSGTEINKLMKDSKNNSVYLGSRFFQFNEGDYIKVTLDIEDTWVWIQFDPTVKPALVWSKEKEIKYTIPSTDLEKNAYMQGAFISESLMISAHYSSEIEVGSYRNLAFNSHDQQHFNGSYPHASANVETRNDATFFACNAIDGILANDDHGSYPYQSWGINQDPKAEMYLDFGRDVIVNKIGIVLRADFPHDSWWKAMTIQFSDKTDVVLKTIKSDQEQVFDIPEKTISSLVLKDLIKGDEALYPALTQIMVYGTEAK